MTAFLKQATTSPGPVGTVYWVTGLSAAGKSTLCRLLAQHLRARGRPIAMLDGDELRQIMDAEHGHTRADRLAMTMRYARLCRLLSTQGIDVALATISLFKEAHDWNRANIPGYLEIYLKVPMAELRRRDPKQIYARAARGEISNVAGLDQEVDFPVAPHLTIEYRAGLTPEATLRELLEKISIDL